MELQGATFNAYCAKKSNVHLLGHILMLSSYFTYKAVLLFCSVY